MSVVDSDEITQCRNQTTVKWIGCTMMYLTWSLQKYYAKKSKQDKVMFSEKLKKVEDDDALKKKAQQQQDGIIEMMKMQMRDAQERADRQLEDALNRPKSASSVVTDPEIYELREEVEKLENKLDDMMNQLEDSENENSRLGESVEEEYSKRVIFSCYYRECQKSKVMFSCVLYAWMGANESDWGLTGQGLIDLGVR